MFLTLNELFDMALMIAVVGFVFMNAFKTPKKMDDLNRYLKKSSFNWDDFWFASLVTAPAIILHEFGHKISAISFGLNAEFNAAYMWLGIAILMRLMNFPFLFFVPAFVSITGPATTGEYAFIAFAGPLVNLIIFLIAIVALKLYKLNNKQMQFWILTKNINLFLFAFNMIPIPGFDGFQVFSALFQMIF